MQNKVHYGRWENGELSLLAFSLFYCLRKGQTWQKRLVDNCGCYENHIFCENGEFGKDLSKVWQSIYMRQRKRPIGSWRFSRKWHIGENWELGKNGKTSNEVTKREILTNDDYKKMANFARTREISAKMASIPDCRMSLASFVLYLVYTSNSSNLIG